MHVHMFLYEYNLQRFEGRKSCKQSFFLNAKTCLLSLIFAKGSCLRCVARKFWLPCFNSTCGYLMKVERVVGGWSYGIRGFANYWLDEWRGGEDGRGGG